MTVHAALHLPKQDYSNLAVLVTSTGMCAILLQTQVFTLRREFFALGMSYSIGFIQFNDRPFKRSRVDSPSTGNGPFGDAIDRLVNDDEVPGHLKTVLAHLVKRTSSVEVLLKKNHELEERLKAELAEKSCPYKSSDMSNSATTYLIANMQWLFVLLLAVSSL
ncbi:hypothetical protein Y032_0387g476 [Ancylostoma ceylanicum]|uniref:Uncharacterized protein n=1 Tax=Ancylostoma ceylanicum TaxID=53326 RepID=A0A016RT64_9BILA|nr:hypothetical protein Y032_0387g476 [Ancylostoma ceylanicum]